MALSNVSGFPRIGRNRELKFATEGYWRGETSADELAATAKAIRVENWKLMQDRGDRSDPLQRLLATTTRCSTRSPGRRRARSATAGTATQVDLDTYFAMARGRQTTVDVTAMEMTKWFDTNYHYLVPELGPETEFSLSGSSPSTSSRGDGGARDRHGPGADRPGQLPAALEAGRRRAESFDPLDLIEPLVEVYGEVIERLAEQGATWVQLDEPCFVEDRSEQELDALRLAYEELCKVHERPRILVKTYFDHVGDAYGVLRELPIEGVGLDFTGFVHGPAGATSTSTVAATTPSSSPNDGLGEKWLFAGIVDGRNVWIDHLEHSLDALEGLRDRTRSSSSRPAARCCTCRSTWTPSRRGWMRISMTRCAPGWRSPSRRWARWRPLPRDWPRAARRSPTSSTPTTGRSATPGASPPGPEQLEVRARIESLDEEHDRRDQPVRGAQAGSARADRHSRLFPSTTIGSYPQTDEIRADPRRS